jgi:hypothetical protein
MARTPSLLLILLFACGDARATDGLYTLPEGYESRSACEKQDYLWKEKILSTQHQKLPPYRPLGFSQAISMMKQGLSAKVGRKSDVAPEGWVKYLHAVGSVAKIEFVPASDTPFTGIFQGARCGLTRLSLTFDPSKKGVAPGAAFKFFIDGLSSVNFSALPSLRPQGQNYNFFAHPMSNVVPQWSNPGAQLIRWIFKKVTHFPEWISLAELAEVTQAGTSVSVANAPFQVFLVPEVSNSFSESPTRDVRTDFAKIPVNVVLFKIYVPDATKYKHFDYSKYSEEDRERLRTGAKYIGKIVTRSKFISSRFGDDVLFFRHERVRSYSKSISSSAGGYDVRTAAQK